ncbi:MAG: MurR/RpiR family transcriptional regulator, partial [Butyricicoccus sp.]
IQDSDLMRMQAVFQDKDSLVFGISVSGETEPVLYLLREARRRGARTVLLTAEPPDRFREFCTEVIRMPSLRYLNQGNVISPQFPILLMLDILYSYYAAQDKGKKELLHDDTLRALDDGKAQRRIKGASE